MTMPEKRSRLPIDKHNKSTPSKSILIIDDDDMLLKVLVKGFEISGMNVFAASNGLDGWDIFNREDVDVVLTDIWMPGLDGIELSRRIRKASPDITIALMTGDGTASVKALLADGTADHLLIKPFPLGATCKLLSG